jgi:hypothetical protein
MNWEESEEIYAIVENKYRDSVKYLLLDTIDFLEDYLKNWEE